MDLNIVRLDQIEIVKSFLAEFPVLQDVSVCGVFFSYKCKYIYLQEALMKKQPEGLKIRLGQLFFYISS